MSAADTQSAQAGPVLEASDLGRAVARALLQHNPQATLRDQGAYLRVQAPQRLRIGAAQLEQALGRPFTLPGELEAIMPAFRGRLKVSDEGAEWSAP
jgi:hypothetical protein